MEGITCSETPSNQAARAWLTGGRAAHYCHRVRRDALTAGLTLLVAMGAGCSVPPRQAILITIDALRDDHVGPRAAGDSLTPALDRLRGDGVRFEDALTSATTTMASHASMLTGLRPHRHGLTGNDGALDSSLTTLAGLLRAQGVRTGAVVSSFVLRSEGGLGLGFETYDESFDLQEQTRVGQRVKTPAATTRAALDFVVRHRREPFVLWVHYFPPHGPYTPPPAYLRKDDLSPQGRGREAIEVSAGNYERGKIPKYQRLEGVGSARAYRDRYAAHVRYVDEHVGQLLDGLRKWGLYDRALVIATSDHGESLGEHGWYFCHGNLVYQEQAHVPLLVKWPRDRPGAGRSAKAPVELVDVMPTVLAFFGVAPPGGLDGRDLEPLLRAQGVASDRVRVTQSTDGELTAVVLGPAKLVERRGPARLVDEAYPQQQLFRLDRDAGESQDIASQEPALVRTLLDLLPRCRRPVRQQGLVSETREQLRTLGYVVDAAGGEPCADAPVTPRPH
jgi:arylsulfatase